MTEKLHHLCTYTDELAEAICARLEMGESLHSICKTTGFPLASTVRRWANDDVCGFAAKYARARDMGIDHRAELMLEKAADESIPPESRRIQIDADKWYISKIAPKRYGDRIQHEHSGALIAGTIVIGTAAPGDAAKLIEGKVESDDVE